MCEAVCRDESSSMETQQVEYLYLHNLNRNTHPLVMFMNFRLHLLTLRGFHLDAPLQYIFHSDSLTIINRNPKLFISFVQHIITKLTVPVCVHYDN